MWERTSNLYMRINQQIELVVDSHRSDHRGDGNGGPDCCCCCCCCWATADGRRAGGGYDTTFPPLTLPHPAFRNATVFASSTMNGAWSFTAMSNTSHTHCLPLSGNMFRVARVAVSFAHTFAVNDVILSIHNIIIVHPKRKSNLWIFRFGGNETCTGVKRRDYWRGVYTHHSKRMYYSHGSEYE